MQIHNMNKYIEFTRAKLQEKGTSTTDHYMKTLEAATIKEDDYFANLLGSDIAGIAKDIKEAHKKDSIPEMTQQKLMRLKRPLNRFRKQIMLHRLK